MDAKAQLVTFLEEHYKKIVAVLSGGVILYVVYRYCTRRSRKKPELTVEQIRRLIEELPFEARNSESNLNLKDLLDELKDINEDEEWKRLISSAQNIYSEDNLSPG